MNFKKLKELIKSLNSDKNKRNKVIASVVAGIIIISLGGALIVHNKINGDSKNNKEVATSNKKKEENKKTEDKEKKEENKTVSEEEAKKQLEELKNMDKSNLTEEEKKETEEKIKSIETMIENKEYERAGQEVATIKNNIVPNSTSSNSNTSTKKEEISNNVEEVKKETVETKQNTNTGSSEKKEIAPKSIDEKKHNHKWVDITEEIHHPEEGHWEEVVITPEQVKEVPVYERVARDICNGCGLDVTDIGWKHAEEQMLAGNYACGGHHTEYKEVQTGTKKEVIPAVTEKRWIVDKPAWTEVKVVGRKCKECGDTE